MATQQPPPLGETTPVATTTTTATTTAATEGDGQKQSENAQADVTLTASQRKRLKKKQRKQKALEKKNKEVDSEEDDTQQPPSPQASDGDTDQHGEPPVKKKQYTVWLGDDTPFDHLDTMSGASGASGASAESDKAGEDHMSKTKFGTLIEPVAKRFRRANEEEKPEAPPKPKKQHNGLRCNKCFCLLCRDDDFEYKNGKLYVDRKVLRDWDGMIIKGGTVFCQKMHIVGSIKPTTWTTKTKLMIVLKTDHTTFVENFLHNPKWANTDKVKNKLNYSESDGGQWLKLSLPDQKYLPTNEEIVPDRYHPEEVGKASGVQNWLTKS